MLLTFTSLRWRTAVVGAMIATASWLPGIVAEKTQADYFIQDLPGAPEGPLLKMHAGYANSVRMATTRIADMVQQAHRS
jgi:carboxypeptidase D